MSFDRIAVIHNLYVSPETEEAIQKMDPPDLREDLRQEVFLVLCKLSEAKLKDLHLKGHLKWFVVGVMLKMVKSDRSTFYNTYRKPTSPLSFHVMEGKPGDCDNAGDGDGTGTVMSCKELAIVDDEESEDWRDRINGIIEELDPYEAGLLRLYSEMGQSCRPIATATGISERGIRFAIARAKEKVKIRLRQ